MAVKSGFPSGQNQLALAVRKVLFSSAAATAIAVAAPGHAVAADVNCIPGQLGAPVAGDSVTCTGAFDETINYDVADMTLVDETSGATLVSPGDLTVVVAEGSSAAGIAISSVTAAGGNPEATGSITIENGADIVQGGDQEGIAIDPSLVKDMSGFGRSINWDWQSGVYFDSAVAIEPESYVDDYGYTRTRYIASGEVYSLGGKLSGREAAEQLGIAPELLPANGGLIDDLTIVVAPEGTFDNAVLAAVSAETQAGDIAITNTGDLSVGSGAAITYYTDYYLNVLPSGQLWNSVDTDGDGVYDLKVYGGVKQVAVYDSQIREATIATAGIAADTTSGNITLDNAGSISAGDVSRGMVAHTVEGDISITNSGDIAVGENAFGIHASSDVQTQQVGGYAYASGSAYAVEYNPGFFGSAPSYTHFYREYSAYAHQVDTTDSVIAIDNSGSITVGAGSTGIHAENPSGAGIVIENSGDIVVEGGSGGAGIYASTAAGLKTKLETTYTSSYRYIAEGEADPERVQNGLTSRYGYTTDHNQGGVYYNHLVPVFDYSGSYPVATGEYTSKSTRHYTQTQQTKGTGYFDDVGDIVISNSGNIDMSRSAQSAGIAAMGHGDTTINNSGDILVGVQGAGIQVAGVGEKWVGNSGHIQMGEEGGIGIRVDAWPGQFDAVEMYGIGSDEATVAKFKGFHNGDITVVNEGTISAADNSHLTQRNESGELTSVAAGGDGISIYALGSNLVSNGSAPWSQYGQDVAEYIGVGEYFDPDIELYDLNVLNTGDIHVADMSNGIFALSKYGQVTVENRGTITIGDGVHGEFAGGGLTWFNPGGMVATNWPVEGFSDNFLLNSGDIVAGDLTVGMDSNSWHGSSVVVNDGSIAVGNGSFLQLEAYDHGINSAGIRSISAGGMNAYAAAQNNGEISTGDRAYGMVVSNIFTNGLLLTPELNERVYTAVAVNNGVITTGDYSSGMVVKGYLSSGVNNGSISIGSGDMQVNTNVQRAAGMKNLDSDGLQSVMVNSGEISGGNQVTGIYSQAVYALAAQTEGASIELGDDTVGMLAVGYSSASVQNQGSVTVGDRSIGLEAFGSLGSVVNTGIVTTGDNGIGVRLSSAYVETTDPETGEVLRYAGSVYNSGSISTGEGGIAIESTQDFDVQIVNTGNIRGSIVTGGGNDVLLNTVRVDEAGDPVAAGRIELHDAFIDLGAGTNTFINEAGDIVFSGESAIRLGAGGSMKNYSVYGNYVTISGVNGRAGDTLTIDGDVNFTSIQSNGVLMVDVGRAAADRIVINGDLAVLASGRTGEASAASALGLAVNVVDQGKGEHTSGPILTVNGDSDAEEMVLTAIGGAFADTVLSADLVQDGSGQWMVTYTSGLSALGAAASSVSHLAESFWLRSATAFQDRERGANATELGRESGLHLWTMGFHTDSDIASQGDLAQQDLGFSQLLSGSIAGATYATKLGNSWLSISPMVGMGAADGAQLEQQSGAALDAETLALSASWSLSDFYVSAMVQSMEFDAGISAYDSRARTAGKAEGFSVEGGWTYSTESGIALTPFAQWSDVKVVMDAFTSSDGNFDYAYDLGNSKRARLGLNLSKSFEVGDGFVAPYVTFSAVSMQNANNHQLFSNGVAFGSDVSGEGMQIDFGAEGEYRNWIVKGGLGVHSGDVDKNGLSGHLSFSRSL
ncbi:hypothetical protein [Microbulbifer magnicolonia]|uniref:hypothetical protein n=1 Tax=Microbulbifer magnicolonia TaxID=3109744 RepID=UPI002B40C818|nr:hypothetical protein [Microbulbifer sp. GG15]